MPSRRVAVLALACLVACSYSYTYTLDVQIAEDVVVAAGVRVVMLEAQGEGTIDQATEFTGTQTIDGQRSYSAQGQTCCSPEPDISLFAFLDLDGSGRWEMGEPWGADPNNPITIRDDSYVGQITIVNDP